jgi:hypothetical protein
MFKYCDCWKRNKYFSWFLAHGKGNNFYFSFEFVLKSNEITVNFLRRSCVITAKQVLFFINANCTDWSGIVRNVTYSQAILYLNIIDFLYYKSESLNSETSWNANQQLLKEKFLAKGAVGVCMLIWRKQYIVGSWHCPMSLRSRDAKRVKEIPHYTFLAEAHRKWEPAVHWTLNTEHWTRSQFEEPNIELLRSNLFEFRLILKSHWHKANSVGYVWFRVRVIVTLRLTVGQSVCLGVEPRPGLMTRCSLTLWKLRSCLISAPSLTRGRACPLSV